MLGFILVLLSYAGSFATIGWVFVVFRRDRIDRFNGATRLLFAFVFVATTVSAAAGLVIGGNFGGAYGAALGPALGQGEPRAFVLPGVGLGIWFVTTAPILVPIGIGSRLFLRPGAATSGR